MSPIPKEQKTISYGINGAIMIHLAMVKQFDQQYVCKLCCSQITHLTHEMHKKIKRNLK